MESLVEKSKYTNSHNFRVVNEDGTPYDIVAWPKAHGVTGYTQRTSSYFAHWNAGCCSSASYLPVFLIDGKYILPDDKKFMEIIVPVVNIEAAGYDEKFIKKYIKFLNVCGFPVSYHGTQYVKQSGWRYPLYTTEEGRDKGCLSYIFRTDMSQCKGKSMVMACFVAIRYLYEPYYTNIPRWAMQIKSEHPKWFSLNCLNIAHWNGKNNITEHNVLGFPSYEIRKFIWPYYYHGFINVGWENKTANCPKFITKEQMIEKFSYKIDNAGIITSTSCFNMNTCFSQNGGSNIDPDGAIKMFQEGKIKELYKILKGE